MFESLTLSPHFTLSTAPDVVPSSDLKRRIDAIWETLVAKRPDLFDGSIMSVVELSAERCVVVRATYRQLLAGLHDAAVKQELGLRPLAVSGILSCRDGLVFGLRSATVTQGVGLWELVPSGGVEALDMKAQIFTELHEEVGLTSEQVTVAPPKGLIEDTVDGLVDVVFPISTTLSAAEVMAAHACAATKEYDSLHITSAPHAFAHSRQDLVAVSRAILETFAHR